MRLAPALVLVVFAIVATLWLSRDPAVHEKAFPPGSSFGTGPDGTSLARAYLEAQGSQVTTLSGPLVPEKLSAGTVLLRLAAPAYRDGASPAAKKAASDGGSADAGVADVPRARTALTAQEEEAVRNGATLVLGIRGAGSSGPARKVSPLLPGVARLEPPTPYVLEAPFLLDVQPVFEHGETPSLARRTLGAGEAYFLAEPELLFNGNLGKADHLALLLALAGGRRRVVFDELVHGVRTEAGLLGLLREWGLGPALVVAALAVCALALRHAVTIGPPADPWRDPRSESVELVDSMAGLYQRALSPAEALQLYRRHLVHEISLRLVVGEKQAEALFHPYAPTDVADMGRLSDAELRDRLARLVSAWERFRDEHRLGRT